MFSANPVRVRLIYDTDYNIFKLSPRTLHHRNINFKKNSFFQIKMILHEKMKACELNILSLTAILNLSALIEISTVTAVK